MYSNGQRRLRIPIFHGRYEYGGTVVSSVGGNLSSQIQQNLANLLADIRNTGFSEIEVVFLPAGLNSPASWTTFSDDYWNENWNVIANIHPIIVNSGLAYKIDLYGEGIPASSQPALLTYDQKLWAYYNFVYGKNDTVGFSIIPTLDQLAQIPSVYGPSQWDPAGNYGFPYLYDLHIYQNALQVFTDARNALNSQGYNPGWIIGEAFYNDPNEAQALRAAINSTGQFVWFVLQWPTESSSGCDVAVAPPSDFSNYIDWGF